MAWHEEDEFWEAIAIVNFDAEQWGRAPAEVDGVLALSGLRPGARVLDIGCGPGRHSLELARRGFRVTGLDRTQVFLSEAKRRADAERLSVDWIRGDMRTFREPAAFDGAICLFTTFGYFDEAGNLAAAANAFESLRPGGVLIVDTLSREALERRFEERRWDEVDGRLLLQDGRIAGDRIESRWIILGGGERVEVNHSVRLYSGPELEALLRRAGFGSVDLFGDLEGSPYEEPSRLVAAAKKNS